MKKGAVSIASILAGTVAGMGFMAKIKDNKLAVTERMSGKHLALFLMMNQWVKVKQEGKNLSSYLVKNGYQRIAVYGMSYAGETFIKELENSSIEVAYGIDKNVDILNSDIEIKTMEASLEEVDAVVVTAITFFDEIEEKLCKKLNCPIISLEDILYMV